MMKPTDDANEIKRPYARGRKGRSLKRIVWMLIIIIALIEYAVYLWLRIEGREVSAPNLIPLIIQALGGL
nr:MAG TPA: hypothetical protein [Caudoviricetes sp.]